jgi:hypothetical protein
VGRDALEAVSVRAADRVVLVGAFTPFIKTLKDRVARLWIVDKNRAALKPAERSWWRSPEQAVDKICVIQNASSYKEMDHESSL